MKTTTRTTTIVHCWDGVDRESYVESARGIYGRVTSHYVDVDGVRTRGSVRLIDGEAFFTSDDARERSAWEWATEQTQ